ncbi:MAG: hypothetical protein V8Q27_10425 [Eubacteriales bacterium]
MWEKVKWEITIISVKEMEAIVGVCRSEGVISKVIFEICYLTEEEIIQIAKIAKEVKPDFVTEMGFGTGGATVVKLVKQTVGDEIKVGWRRNPFLGGLQNDAGCWRRTDRNKQYAENFRRI